MPRAKRGTKGLAKSSRRSSSSPRATSAAGASCIAQARETVEKGLVYAYRDRRVRSASSAACGSCASTPPPVWSGLSYCQLMHGLKKGGIEIDRKMLADLAMRDPDGFNAVAEVAKAQLAA